MAESQANVPFKLPHLSPPESANSSISFYIYCVSIYSAHKRVCFHSLLLVGVELCLSIYVAFSLKNTKDKNTTKPFSKTLPHTDPVFPSSTEMIDGITEAAVKAATLWMSPLTWYQLNCIQHFC